MAKETKLLNTGLRLHPDTMARVEKYLVRLQREPGRAAATGQDALRALVDLGLAAVEPPKKAKRS